VWHEREMRKEKGRKERIGHWRLTGALFFTHPVLLEKPS